MSSGKASDLTIKQDFVDMLSTFSHWTYEQSDGYLMVVDLQGAVVSEAGETTILLTDPAIHCIDVTRFSATNLNHHGMKIFFARHKCNAVCHKLKLKKEEAADIATGA
jgi:hypothetical protein